MFSQQIELDIEGKRALYRSQKGFQTIGKILINYKHIDNRKSLEKRISEYYYNDDDAEIKEGWKEPLRRYTDVQKFYGYLESLKPLNESNMLILTKEQLK